MQSLLLLCTLLVVNGQNASPPHIIMILGDDIGWANVAWHRQLHAPGTNEAVTPALAALLSDGIELDNFRTFKYCSPSRSAFQTGRNPIHVTVVNGGTDLNNPSDPVSGWTGIPTNMTSIAEKLRGAGYRAHATGYISCHNSDRRHVWQASGMQGWPQSATHLSDVGMRAGASSCG